MDFIGTLTHYAEVCVGACDLESCLSSDLSHAFRRKEATCLKVSKFSKSGRCIIIKYTIASNVKDI